MILDDLEHQNRVFNGFFGNFGLQHKSTIHKVVPRNYRYAIQIENLVFLY